MYLKKKVSIIVPIYNAEEYLYSCIYRIVSQSYCNLDILLVNDGSTDHSREICERFAEKDNRITLFNTKNNGVSSARNIGLENAKGDFVTFVDADDLIHKDYIKVLLNDINKYQTDIVQCGISELYPDKTVLKVTKYKNKIQELDNQFNFCKNTYIGFVWGKLFRKDLIKDISFDEEIEMSEDALYIAHVIKKSKKIYYEKRCLYLYRIHLQSSMRLQKEKMDFTALKAKKCIFNIQEEGSQAYYSSGILYLEMCRRNAAELWLSEGHYDNNIEYLQNEVRSNISLIWKANEKMIQKVLLLLFICLPKTYYSIYLKKKISDRERLITKCRN